MKNEFKFDGLLFASHDETFAIGSGPAPKGVFSKTLDLEGGFTVIPLPAGIDSGHLSHDPKEITSYLNHGMVLRASMILANHGSGLCVKDVAEFTAIGAETDSPHILSESEKMQIAAAQDFTRELSAYRNAYMNNGLKVEIEDWQGTDRADKTTPDSIKLLIERDETRLSLSARDGRKVEIELQDGELRVLAYEQEDGKEFPVITSLPRSGDIRTERSDYDAEDRPEAEEDGDAPGWMPG